ncbi:MAG: hypothetical protein ACI906_000999 [Candidatus Latescibacterota bacterium]|jgi:uncharacterized protein (DUF342 family)
MTGSQKHTNHLEWHGKPLPCVVRAAIYEKGLAAGVGIKSTNAQLLTQFLDDPDRYQLFSDLLRKQIVEELANQGVVFGIDDAEVNAAVHDFVEMVSSAGGDMVSRRVASGNAAGAGIDGCFEYALNPSGLPLKTLGWEEQKRVSRQMRQVKTDEVLVRYQPPERGMAGQTVRGEAIAAGDPARDVALADIVGTNTRVDGHRLLAEIDGVYREVLDGTVRVVQELEVDRVNATTGDLPAAGIGDFNAWVRGGVGGGAALLTHGDVLIGTLEKPAAIESGTRVLAGNLCVRGPVAGNGVPEAYLTGELESLDPDQQEQVLRELDGEKVEVEGVFIAREVLLRNVRAVDVFVQKNAFNAALDAGDDIWIDGDLVGGMVACGGRLLVRGDIGNKEGGTTRILFSMGAREAQRLQQVDVELQDAKIQLSEKTKALQEHLVQMQERRQQSPYWDALMKDEKRPPSKPLEKRLLDEYLKAVKEQSLLERGVADTQRYVWDVEERREHIAEDEEEGATGALQVRVGGTLYAGTRFEMVRPLEPADLKRSVKNRAGMDTAIQMIRNKLAEQIAHHIELYREGVEERRKAMEDIYRDRSDKPPLPEIPNKRFEEAIVFAAGKEGATANEGVIFAQSRHADSFFIRLVHSVRESQADVVVEVECNEEEGNLVVRYEPGKTAVNSWQQDRGVLERLEDIRALGRTARGHLFPEEEE